MITSPSLSIFTDLPPVLSDGSASVNSSADLSIHRTHTWSSLSTQKNVTGGSVVNPLRAALMREQMQRTPRLRVSDRTFMKGFQSTEHDYFHVLPEDFEASGPPFACSYANYKNAGNLLAVADEDGRVTIINTAYNNIDDCAENRVSWTAHDNAIMDLQWTLDDERIVTASADNSALVTDVITQTQLYRFIGHGASVKSVACNPRDSYILATGSRDGNVYVWDTRCAKHRGCGEDLDFYRPVDSITGAHAVSATPRRRPKQGKSPTSQANSVTSVVFLAHDVFLASSGSGDGTVKLWDLRFNKRHHGKRVSEPVDRSHVGKGNKRSYGITALCLNRQDNSLFACSRDGHLYEYRTSSIHEPIARYSDSNLQVGSYFVRAAVSPDGRFVACGSSDKAVHMWEVGGSQRPSAIFNVHEKEVTCIAWHKRRAEQFATVSDDVTVRIWNMRRGQADVIDPDEDGKKWLRSTVEDGKVRPPHKPTSRLAAHLARKRKPQQFDSQLSQLSSEFDSLSSDAFSSPFAMRIGLGNASATPYSIARRDAGLATSPWILSGTSRVMDDKENELTPCYSDSGSKRVRSSLTSPTRI